MFQSNQRKVPKSKWQRVTEYLRLFDILYYDNFFRVKDKQSSYIGACASILLIMIVSLYMTFNTMRVITKANFDIKYMELDND